MGFGAPRVSSSRRHTYCVSGILSNSDGTMHGTRLVCSDGRLFAYISVHLCKMNQGSMCPTGKLKAAHGVRIYPPGNSIVDIGDEIYPYMEM